MHHRRILQADQAGGDENMTRGGDSRSTTPTPTPNSRYMREGNLDTNMVIILAALLCALIFALGLNSIVRCALRCGRRVALETPQRGLGASTAGLKKRELRQIPVTIYGTTTSNNISCGISSTLEECAICLGEFVDGERVRVLPICNHAFHVACIDTWLLSHSSCPNCRHSLLLDRDKERVSA